MRATKLVVRITIVGVCAIIFAAAPFSFAGLIKPGTKIKNETSADKVNVTTTLRSLANGKQIITIKMKIDDGWYIYANKPQNKSYDRGATVVKITGPNVDRVTLKYPVGDLNFFGKQHFRIYKGEVAITAIVTRKNTTLSPMEMSIHVNACDKSKCLFQSIIKQIVK